MKHAVSIPQNALGFFAIFYVTLNALMSVQNFPVTLGLLIQKIVPLR